MRAGRQSYQADLGPEGQKCSRARSPQSENMCGGTGQLLHYLKTPQRESLQYIC